MHTYTLLIMQYVITYIIVLSPQAALSHREGNVNNPLDLVNEEPVAALGVVISNEGKKNVDGRPLHRTHTGRDGEVLP